MANPVFDMEEIVIYGKALPEVYHKALLALQENGHVTDCADWNTTQKEVSMTMCVAEPLSEPRISKCFIGGPKELEQYRQEMLYGILDFEVEKGNWAYTYHQRYADQIPFIIDELKRNPSSRRAVMLVRDKAADLGSDDPACLQHIQYFIRENRLCCKVLFRSNDACKAAFMNAFALICLQEYLAKEIGVEMGSYVHRANSFHCYEKDFALLEGYVKRICEGDEEDVTFDYEDGWDELMEDAKEEIAAQVEQLKKN
ncbi:MAG: thymidylate synthase [Eubacteriales bacterium]|nr:thymidylate synthase [Eubacteriales bacterium]